MPCNGAGAHLDRSSEKPIGREAIKLRIAVAML